MREITVHIEELVLPGSEWSVRYRVADALEQELTSLIAQPPALPIFSRNATIACVEAVLSEPASGVEAAERGGDLARSIYRGLMR
jgi:hypothetical protein